MSLENFRIIAAAVRKEFKECSALCNEVLRARGEATHGKALLLADENLDAALSWAMTALEDVIALAGQTSSPQATQPKSSPAVRLPLRMPLNLAKLQAPDPQEVGQSSFIDYAEPHQQQSTFNDYADPHQNLDPHFVANCIPGLPQEPPAAQRMPFTLGKIQLRQPAPDPHVAPAALQVPLQMQLAKVGQSSSIGSFEPPQKQPRLWNAPKARPRAHTEASGLNAKQTSWFANLPSDNFTDGEEALRTALLEFLANWKATRPAIIAAVMNGQVGLAAKEVLPKSVSLNKWVEQRMGDEVECKRDGNTFSFSKTGEAFEVCWHFKEGRCNSGDQCRYRH